MTNAKADTEHRRAEGGKQAVTDSRQDEVAEGGIGCATKLKHLSFVKCGIGPEGSRALASVLHRLTALTRLQVHDEVAVEVHFENEPPPNVATRHLVTKGLLLPIGKAKQQDAVTLNLHRVHAHVPSLLNCGKGASVEELEKSLSLSYCAAKAAAGVAIDLLQELSDAAGAFPNSQVLRERQTLVSRSMAFLRERRGREAAFALLQLAYQEPGSTGLPDEVKAVEAKDLAGEGETMPLMSAWVDQALIAWVNQPEQRPDATLLTISEHTKQVNCIAMFPCGKLLASASDDGDVLICSAATGEVKCRLLGHNGAGRGGCICSASEDGAEVYTNEDCTLRGHVGPVKCVAVRHDGEMLCTGGKDGAVCTWERKGTTSVFALRNMCKGHSNDVTAVAFNPKNPGQLASASSDKTLKIWSVADGQCQQTLQHS